MWSSSRFEIEIEIEIEIEVEVEVEVEVEIKIAYSKLYPFKKAFVSIRFFPANCNSSK